VTREEALQILRYQMQTHIASEVDLHIAMGMAIEALRETSSDGCEGCKYMEKDQYEMPCLNCKHSHKNMWTRGE